MGYTVETRAGKTGPINRVPPTPRFGDGEPGRKRTVYDRAGGRATGQHQRSETKEVNDMYRADRRSQKRFRSRYGHFGIGATHIREASEAEVRRHVENAELRSSKRRRK